MGIGIDSVIQSTAINPAAPAVRQPSALRPGGCGRISVAASKAGPRIHPLHCLVP